MKFGDNIELLNCDCMDYMSGIDDKFFDFAIVDPPYGIGEASGQEISRNNSIGRAKTKTKYSIKTWDNDSPKHKYFEELFRVSKNQIVFGANHFMSQLYIAAPFAKNIDSSCWIVWDKNNSGDFADCELAWTSFDTAVRKFVYRWNGMLQQDMKNKEQRIHPTQKPVALYKWLLKNYAKEGDTIIDTHLGSGSIAIACHDYQFNLTGCELDKDYYDAACKRLRNHQAQQKLFV